MGQMTDPVAPPIKARGSLFPEEKGALEEEVEVVGLWCTTRCTRSVGYPGC